MDDSKVFMFPDGAKSGIDPNLMLALNNNGGFGNNGWIWLLFLWMIGFGGNGWGNGGFGNNGYLANQIANGDRADLVLQAVNGRADALSQLAQITNTSVETVKNGIFSLQNSINQVGTQVGMSGLQVQNAVQSGNAAISQQLCQCCCENRLAICQQTNALQSQLAQHNADVRLQLAQNEASDQLSVCQQTNALQNQAERDTQSILNAISGQNTLITKSNDHQTLQFNAAFHALDDKIDAIAAKQPNTVPVQWPNLIAANATPYVGGYGYGGFGNGFGGSIVF